MRWLQVVVAALGVVVGGFGAWLLLSRQDLDQLGNAAVWLAAGVILHDGVLAFATLLVAAFVLPLLPRAARAPAVVGLVVLGATTLLAVPVLGRFGARPDNDTLLDRNYVAGWLVLAAITLVAVVVASVLRSRAGGTRGPRPGGRRRPHRA
ncbi:hypothetical protein [Nocardioides sp. URHA0020]|uniref:hypothetical protein n=1 Tax=Nocardioides sp. URHA0020 TaxID=1380392 RepID=UPI000686B19D|nr:hypothetical protein [Nocardioides sp. URHA0020]